MKAILYAAKSTLDERGSIPTQLADGRAMAAANGWPVIEEYADEAASAWSGDRGPRLAAAIAHAERLAPCVMVVQHSDRLARGDGRNARHLGEIYFWALKADVQIRSVQDDSTFTNPLLAFAMGERNAEDSRRKSLAVKAGMDRRARKGLWNGGQRPYGYVQGQAGALEVVPAEAVIVTRIFADFVSGRSMTAIARDLFSERVPTAKGGRWRQATVSGVLGNPVYTGRLPHHDETIPDTHAPIVDADTWTKAGELLASRPQGGRGRPPKGHHLFRKGMLRCECGEAMIARTNGGYQMYYCNGRGKLGKKFCSMPHLRRADIDGAVYRYFEQIALDLDATRRSVEEAQNRKLTEIRALRDQADRDAQRAAEKLARVRRDYTEGRIDAADWREFRDELGGEKTAAEAQVERLTQSQAEVEQSGAMLDAEREVLEHLAQIRRSIAGEIQSVEGVDAVRAALARMFERFVIRRGVPGRVHVELVSDELWIEPVARDREVDGMTESLRPVLRSEAGSFLPVFEGIPVLKK